MRDAAANLARNRTARFSLRKVLKDIMAGKTRVSVKTKQSSGVAGTATRTVGLLGGILACAVEAGIFESNPAHGIRKPKDKTTDASSA